MHEKSGHAIDALLNQCVNFKTLDNITAVLVGFKGIERMAQGKRPVSSPQYLPTELNMDWDKLEKEAVEESHQ